MELFFKWIKQHLHIRTFLGQTPNAVYSQLWAAICVYLLLAIMKKELKLSQSLYQMSQIINLRPFEQTPVAELLAKKAPETETTQNQILFDFNTL